MPGVVSAVRVSHNPSLFFQHPRKCSSSFNNNNNNNNNNASFLPLLRCSLSSSRLIGPPRRSLIGPSRPPLISPSRPLLSDSRTANEQATIPPDQTIKKYQHQQHKLFRQTNQRTNNQRANNQSKSPRFLDQQQHHQQQHQQHQHQQHQHQQQQQQQQQHHHHQQHRPKHHKKTKQRGFNTQDKVYAVRFTSVLSQDQFEQLRITVSTFNIRTIQEDEYSQNIVAVDGKKSYFIFPDGLVSWGVTKDELQEFLNKIMKQEIDLQKLLSEEIDFVYGFDSKKRTFIDTTNDQIVLESGLRPEDEDAIKFVMSIPILHSLELDYFENEEANIVKNLREMLKPKQLSFLSISNFWPSIAASFSHLFNKQALDPLFLQTELNLHSKIGEQPSQCWENSSLDELFDEGLSYWAINERKKKLNDRLTSARDTISTLQSIYTSDSTKRIELSIIFLIFVEVCIGVYNTFWRSNGH